MKLVKKFQDGGSMAPVEDPNAGGMPMGAESMEPQGGEQDPMMVIVDLFAQGLQNQDCEALAQGAQMFLQLVQEAQGGAGQPVFAKGGKLVSRKANVKLVRE